MNAPSARAGRFRISISPRLERGLNILTIVLLVLLVIGVVLWRLPSKYQILLPATAQPVESQIYVAGHAAATGRGQFLMTFVEEPDTNLLLEIVGRLNPDATLEPLPPSYSRQQDIQQGKAQMLSSTQIAELVALCHLGYRRLCAGGVQVVKIEAWSRAAHVLRSGDVITAVDGVAVASPDGLRAALLAKRPGSAFTVTYRRGGATLTRAIPSVRSPDPPYHAVLGVEISSAPLLSVPNALPVDIKINPGNVGGPSAGMMFTLGILNRLSPTDLTHGLKIAGTGTINLDGTVGPIGGVKQKVIGAQWSHARYFFVPCQYGNYDDARTVVGHSMTLVPVKRLDDALSFLRELSGDTRQRPAITACSALPDR